MLLASEAAARGDLEALRASPSTITKTLGHLPLLHLAAEGSFLSIVDFLVAETMADAAQKAVAAVKGGA